MHPVKSIRSSAVDHAVYFLQGEMTRIQSHLAGLKRQLLSSLLCPSDKFGDSRTDYRHFSQFHLSSEFSISDYSELSQHNLCWEALSIPEPVPLWLFSLELFLFSLSTAARLLILYANQ